MGMRIGTGPKTGVSAGMLAGGLAGLLAACAPAGEANADLPRADLPPLALDQAEPRLALVEHVLRGYFTGDIVDPPTVCAAVSDGRSGEALPPEQEIALIARFPRLAPLSRCGWVDSAWRDGETGEPAMVFTIHGFTCASETSCTGWASYTAAAVSSPADLYRMSYADGRWTFERDRRQRAQ